MKQIQAYIKPHKAEAVIMALQHVQGLTGVSVCAVEGWGRGKVQAEHRHHRAQVGTLEPHTKVELFCAEEQVAPAVEAIQEAAYTGLAGDGKIYVTPVEEAVRISTGEKGPAAL